MDNTEELARSIYSKTKKEAEEFCDNKLPTFNKAEKRVFNHWLIVAKYVRKLLIEARIDEVKRSSDREFQFEIDKRIAELEAELKEIE